ncbi:MAG: hypothetical protein COY58_06010 [Gammaproteobacteria bacterium CG_4_10_14_0_8_um_filter_38_16]|nr:MAG: hypothetical protein COY58_06010 [Gammaproteobacteria bacterium CG_4_10_14_0_8_um_filter_38_16]
MAKVHINKDKEDDLTPSQRVVKDSKKTMDVIDCNGRQLKVKTPDFVDTMIFERNFGAIYEKNKKYYESCYLTLFVKEIDGDHIAPARTEAELEIIARKLGSEGVQAIFEFMMNQMGDESTESEKEEKEKQAVKK